MTEQEKIEEILGRARLTTTTELDKQIKADVATALQENLSMPTLRSKERILTMKRIKKIAVAAVIVLGVSALIGLLTRGNAGSGVAFAEIVRRINEAQTLTFTVVGQAEGQETGTSQLMYMGPGHMRISASSNILPPPLPEGSVLIVDLTKGEMLILNPSKLAATKLKTASPVTAIPNLVQEMKNLPDQADRELGAKEINGRKAEGFLVHKHGQDVLLWADQETGLPVRMEGEVVDRKGRKGRWTITDMKFNVDLDESLFSLELPPGFTLKPISSELQASRQDALRAISAVNLNKLANACIQYSKGNGGNWPDSLEQLSEYSITTKELVNPARPEMKPGYIYIKPTTALLGVDQLLIYSAYDEWNGGINVVLGPHGHVKFVTEQDDFKKLLEKAGSR